MTSDRSVTIISVTERSLVFGEDMGGETKTKIAEMARLYRDYLAAGPVGYMAAIFRKMTDNDGDAMQLALDFYGPTFLLYSVYDGAGDKKAVPEQLCSHIDRFIARRNAKQQG